MGLTIYYRGQLRYPNPIEYLMDDAEDICLEIGWRFDLIHPSNMMPAKGMLITPLQSESIWLTFLPNGRMYNCAHFLLTRTPEREVVNEEKHEWNFTKTHFAGAETHMAIIKFLRYLARKYFESFELKDESEYWETNDETLCRQHFGESSPVLDPLARALGIPDEDEEDFEQPMSEEMEEILLKRGGLGWSEN